ncbi:MAG: SIS domain-containing protein [Herbinix sp.]|nr:SIS domain-containing protein [Herbinix sp.]
MKIEKETVELMKFNEESYVREGGKAYSRRGEIEELAKELAKKDYKNVYLLGIGGTEFSFEPFAYLANKKSKLDFIQLNAGTLTVLWPKHLDEKSLVITSSISGTTQETVKATEMLVKKNIDVVAFAPKDTPLAQLSSKVIELDLGEGGGIEHVTMLETFLIYGFLHFRGEFAEYPKYVDQIKNIFNDLVDIRKTFESRADEIAQKTYNAPYSIFTGSGSLWGETMMFSMCFLEEMQWVRTRPCRADQFFHGTLELVEKGVPVFIIKSEDEYRSIDTRVESFCKKINAECYVIDPAEFSICGLDEQFRELVSHWIVCAMLSDRLATYYERYTKHNLNYRRYYRQFEY